MPSGRIHSLANITVAISGATVMLFIGQSTEGIIGVATGAVTGCLISPDADVDSGAIADYYIRVYTSRIVEAVWTMLWLLYRKALKHRSFLSHFPLVSTIIRIFYLGMLCGMFYFLIATPLKYLSGLVRIDWPLFLWWAFVGLVLADTAHWALDELDEKLGGRL